MRPETKALYPDNWAEISRQVIEKAHHTCQHCGRSDQDSSAILTVHHIDYDPSHNDESNLICLCQGCHLRCQADDLREATKHGKVFKLIRMGQLELPGLEVVFPRRLTRVIEGKALATSRRTGRRARQGSGQ